MRNSIKVLFPGDSLATGPALFNCEIVQEWLEMEGPNDIDDKIEETVNYKFKLMEETLYLKINRIDRFLYSGLVVDDLVWEKLMAITLQFNFCEVVSIHCSINA
ncbi:Uncharacterized protein Rs2_03846 [Raphanus sativus]|nr:Uncharacterized protein Rs2_03846 [Raphanus sativus]